MKYWFGDCSNSNILVITDAQQYQEIEMVVSQLVSKSTSYVLVGEQTFSTCVYEHLGTTDLLVVALSIESFVLKGYNQYFSPFRKPENLCGNYVFIRLDISAASLLEGLTTPVEEFEQVYAEYKSIPNAASLLVTNEAGTDLQFEITAFKTCSHRISDHSDIAFLPASELEAGIQLGSATGRIVVDCTVGQINQRGKWLGMFGLVDKPVVLTIQNSEIVEIEGHEELKQVLFSLELECRILVEFGKGLAKMTPTGIIGIDESIIDTCHFGFGDGIGFGIENVASIHFDVVLKGPKVTILSSRIDQRRDDFIV